MEAPSRGTLLAWLVAWLAVSAWLLAGAHREMLDWDEVDYVNAAALGMSANALERGGLGLWDFVRFARAKYEGARPVLPAGYDEARDPLLLRHYHPPGFAYALTPTAGAGAEWVVRLPLLAGAGLFLLAFLYALQVAAGGPSPVVLALGAATAAWLAILGFVRVQGHGWLAVGALALGVGLVGDRAPGQPAARRLTVFALAWTGLMLESAAFLWIAAAAFLVWCRGAWEPRAWREATLTLGAAAVLVAATWPGAVVQASPLRVVGLYAYRLALGEEYAGVARRLVSSFVPYLPLLVLALPLLSGGRRPIPDAPGRPDRDTWRVLLFLGLFYALPMAAVALAPQYVLGGLAPVAVVLVAKLGEVGPRNRVAFAVAWLLAVGIWGALPPPYPRDAAARADYQALARRAQGRTLWADGGHIARRYLTPGQDVRGLTVSRDGADLTRRWGGAYLPVSAEDLAGALVSIMAYRDAAPGRPAPLAACQREELHTMVLYDCP